MFHELWARARFGIFVLVMSALSFFAVMILASIAESLWKGP